MGFLIYLRFPKTILSKIDEEKYADLLSADGLDKTDPIIFDLIKADDPKVTAVLLTAIESTASKRCAPRDNFTGLATSAG